MPRSPRAERRPTNKAEAEFFDAARKEGWMPTKRGWPDYFCTRRDHRTGRTEVAIVEVRRSRGRRVKRQQRELMSLLSIMGIPCYQWDAREGWMKWTPST